MAKNKRRFVNIDKAMKNRFMYVKIEPITFTATNSVGTTGNVRP